MYERSKREDDGRSSHPARTASFCAPFAHGSGQTFW